MAKFTLTRTSDSSVEDIVEIKTLDDIKAIQDKNGGIELVINFNSMSIEIYDDYRE